MVKLQGEAADRAGVYFGRPRKAADKRRGRGEVVIGRLPSSGEMVLVNSSAAIGSMAVKLSMLVVMCHRPLGCCAYRVFSIAKLRRYRPSKYRPLILALAIDDLQVAAAVEEIPSEIAVPPGARLSETDSSRPAGLHWLILSTSQMLTTTSGCRTRKRYKSGSQLIVFVGSGEKYSGWQ